jgi:hypothetical protein
VSVFVRIRKKIKAININLLLQGNGILIISFLTKKATLKNCFAVIKQLLAYYRCCAQKGCPEIDIAAAALWVVAAGSVGGMNMEMVRLPGELEGGGGGGEKAN